MDVFCPDKDFWAEHECDWQEREHQQKEDKRKDLENLEEAGPKLQL